MKTPLRRTPLALLSAAALTCAPLPTHAETITRDQAAAHAAAPGYACSKVTRGTARAQGSGDCKASGGAPTSGKIHGTFTITGQLDNQQVIATCIHPPRTAPNTPSGTAESYPQSVTGSVCRVTRA